NAGKIKQMESAWKDLGDAIKVALAGPVAGVSVAMSKNIQFANALREATQKNILTERENFDLANDVRTGKIEYAEAMEYLTEKTEEHTARVEYLQGAMGPLAPMFKETGEAAEEAALSEEELAAAAEEAAKKAEEYDARVREMAQANATLRASAIDAANSQTDLAIALKGMTDPAEKAQTMIEQLQKAQQADPEHWAVYQKQIDDIAVTFGLASANTAAFAGAVEILPQLLVAGVIDDYAGAWKEMSDYIKTDATPTFGELITAFEKAGLTSGTQADIINQGMDLEPAIEESGRLVSMLDNIANAPLTRNFTYTVHVNTSGPIGILTGGSGVGNTNFSPNSGYEGGGPSGIGHATGGSWIIPSGYEHDNYPLGGGHYGKSGETVTVTPVGQSAPDNGNTELLAALLAEFRNQPRAIALAVEQALQRLGN
ncbi:MAG: hypothetical protein AAGU32_09480, partial [Bacillota bacterium]